MASNSTIPPDVEAEVLAFTQSVSDLQVTRYLAFSSLSLLLYDSILTLLQEIHLVWRRPIRLGAVLYVMARYLTLITCGIFIAYFINALTVSVEVCNALTVSGAVVQCLAFVGVQGALFARGYAVSARNKWIRILLSTLFVLNLSIIIAHVWFAPCDTTRNVTTLKTINTVALAVFEAAILAATMYHAWRERGSLKRLIVDTGSPSLTELFYRQGILRFTIFFAWSLEAAIVQKLVRPSISGIDSLLESAVSTILMCRFMLQLFEANSHLNGTETVQDGPSLGSFHAAAHAIQTSITNDFGDPALYPTSRRSTDSHELEEHGGRNDQAPALTSGLNIKEYPWLVRSASTLNN